MKKYRVNEIFYSLQGEGFHTGYASIFIRFSGCNLHCPFCDTDFSRHEDMTASEIVAECKKYNSHNIVLTGGEPSLQVDAEFVQLLHDNDYHVCMETNGTHRIFGDVDFITCSPKLEYCENSTLAIDFCHELKVVYDGTNNMSKYDNIHCTYRYIQPCDTGDFEKNSKIIDKCVEYIKAHPEWHLSLQTQKNIKIR